MDRNENSYVDNKMIKRAIQSQKRTSKINESSEKDENSELSLIQENRPKSMENQYRTFHNFSKRKNINLDP